MPSRTRLRLLLTSTTIRMMIITPKMQLIIAAPPPPSLPLLLLLLPRLVAPGPAGVVTPGPRVIGTVGAVGGEVIRSVGTMLVVSAVVAMVLVVMAAVVVAGGRASDDSITSTESESNGTPIILPVCGSNAPPAQAAPGVVLRLWPDTSEAGAVARDPRSNTSAGPACGMATTFPLQR